MRYKVVVAYDGHAYHGWQKQPNQNSIQAKIEQYLSQICNHEVEIVASGRTDRYVHALGQVFHFDTHLKMAVSKWKYALNNFLPKDIRIVDVAVVNEDFHARFSAKSKTYRYVYTYDNDNPFNYKYKSILKNRVDIALMQEASSILLGTHDFTSFASNKINPLKSRVKTIYKIDIYEKDQDVILEFNGDGFLRYMVRILSQVLIEVGKQNLTLDDVKWMLEKKDKDICRYKADGFGLYLVNINY